MSDERIDYDVEAALKDLDDLDGIDADTADPPESDESQEPIEQESEVEEQEADSSEEVTEQEVQAGTLQAQLDAFQRRVAEDLNQYKQAVSNHLTQQQQQYQQPQQQQVQPQQQQQEWQYQDPAMVAIAELRQEHAAQLQALQQHAAGVVAYHSRQALDGAAAQLRAQYPDFDQVIPQHERDAVFQRAAASGAFQQPWLNQMTNLYRVRTWVDPRVQQDELNQRRQEKQQKTQAASAAAKVATGGGFYQNTQPAPTQEGPKTWDQVFAAALADLNEAMGG